MESIDKLEFKPLDESVHNAATLVMQERIGLLEIYEAILRDEIRHLTNEFYTVQKRRLSLQEAVAALQNLKDYYEDKEEARTRQDCDT